MRTLKVMQGPSEVAGQNAYSVQGLREIGVDAESVVWKPHRFGYPYDICLGIDKDRKAKLPIFFFFFFGFFLKSLFCYSTFHFHYGHSTLDNHELSIYKIFGKKVFYEFHGLDLRDQERFCSISGIEFHKDEATSPRKHARNRKICKKADGIIIHDDELIPYLPEKCAPVYVVPLRINVSQFDCCPPDPDAKTIRIVHAPSKRAIKGTEYVLNAIDRLKTRYSNIELVLVEGKTQKEALKIFKTADIIVDQLFAGTYGMFAVESMAMGKPVITFISDTMKERLPAELPIVSGDRDSIETVLETLIKDSHMRNDLGIKGRAYVENYHDCKWGAYLLKDIYCGKAAPLTGREAFAKAKEMHDK